MTKPRSVETLPELEALVGRLRGEVEACVDPQVLVSLSNSLVRALTELRIARAAAGDVPAANPIVALRRA